MRAKHDFNLEGLRGLCALTVCYAHLFTFNFFQSKSIPFSNFFEQFHFASVAVLIFFILSGYVIGITYQNSIFSYPAVVLYSKKRFARLYPIYLSSILLAILFGDQKFTLLQFVGHLFFVQDLAVETVKSNVVLWSLSYEVIYYLLFIIIWRYKAIHPLLIAFTLLILSIFAFVAGYNKCSSLLVGSTFWLVGLSIAWNLKPTMTKGVGKEQILSHLFILLATYSLNSGSFYLNLLHIPFNNDLKIPLSDIFYLPICVFIFLIITRREFKYLMQLKAVCYIIPSIHISLLVYFKHNIFEKQIWFWGTVYLFLAIILFFIKTKISIFQKLSYVGRISYAIYVLHFPIAYYLNIHFWLGEGLSTFAFTTLIWVLLTFVLSYIFEMKFQPLIKNFLFK
nr:acyltransferase family protein [Pedobacter sp. SYSU D00823]